MTSFRGAWAGFSNFAPCPLTIGGITYPTVEHAFVAAKTNDVTIRRQVAAMLTPSAAKKFGRTITLRPDWDEKKLVIMERLCRLKFTQNAQYHSLLLSTGDQEIVEENEWHDTFWGVCRGIGENYLGKILMKIRSALKAPLWNGRQIEDEADDSTLPQLRP